MTSLDSHPQREWILVGIAECCARRGLERTSVEDVCAAAGVSREAFEREFSDLGECLGAAMESIVGEAWRALERTGAADRPWAAALRDAARAALLDFLERGRDLTESDVPASAARGALAGAEALIERRVLAGEAAGLAELAPAVTYMLAVPFVGIDEAQRLASNAAKRRHLRAVA